MNVDNMSSQIKQNRIEVRTFPDLQRLFYPQVFRTTAYSLFYDRVCVCVSAVMDMRGGFQWGLDRHSKLALLIWELEGPGVCCGSCHFWADSLPLKCFSSESREPRVEEDECTHTHTRTHTHTSSCPHS